MDASQDFSSFQERISSMLINTTRVVNQLHSHDLSFHRSLDPTVSAAIDKQNARLLNLAECLLKTAISGTEVEAPDVKEVDDLDNNWNGIVEVVDSLLERADMCLDEYTGAIKKPNAVEEEVGLRTPVPTHSRLIYQAAVSRPPPPKRNANNVLRTRNDLPKPQLLFKRKPLNDANGPFKPLLTTKPHAVLPLAQSLGTVLEENGNEQSKHPYRTEILQLQYPPSVFAKSTPVSYPSLESTTAIWVDTPEAVASMLEELKTSKEIAVDLEHHDARSYVGLVSLMQISTRGKDWIVDTLKPWREDLQVLNEVFADPGIVKVFHGAHMDIVWLQRDLGLYVVGLLDTYHAASVLGYAGRSLAFLLKKFVGFNADKRYQRADWRIRPLTEEMFKYARSDTHFLLFIYDHLRNELIDKSNPAITHQSCIENVLARSRETALQTYEPDIYDEVSGENATGWSNMLQKTLTNFTSEQFSIFKAIHQWRDKTARQTDESLNYVMPKHLLFSIARAMPTDVQSLFGLSPDIPSLVKVRASELVGVIRQARENSEKNPMHIPSRGFAAKGKPALISSGAISLPKGPGRHYPTSSFENTWSSEATPKVDVFLDQTVGSVVHAKTTVSRFWGAAFGSSLWHPAERTNLINEGIRLAVPLPQLTAEIFESEVTVGHDLPAAGPKIRAEHQYVKKRKAAELDEENVFVIKQLGREQKRKLDKMEKPAASVSKAGYGSPEGTTADCDMNEGDAETRAQERKYAKKERRRLRKEEKKRREMEQVGQGGEALHNGMEVCVDENEQEPFDYAAAPSVLHGKAEVPDRSSSRKAFNPYAKSGDTSKGLHRSRKEVPGKSTTFKR